jgi:predicted component of type VI protein secretion system
VALLRDLSGFTGAAAHELTTRHTRISRRPGLDSNASRTLVIDDSNISRNHALIECRDDGFWIADLGSVNGTYVNDQRVSEQPQPLRSGDTVRFARYAFEFTIPGKQNKARIIPSASRFPGSDRQAGHGAPAAAGGDDASALQTETGRDEEDATQLRPKQ